jgi:hypothetical protein
MVLRALASLPDGGVRSRIPITLNDLVMETQPVPAAQKVLAAAGSLLLVS